LNPGAKLRIREPFAAMARLTGQPIFSEGDAMLRKLLIALPIAAALIVPALAPSTALACAARGPTGQKARATDLSDKLPKLHLSRCHLRPVRKPVKISVNAPSQIE
jgi:hypothetical protein